MNPIRAKKILLASLLISAIMITANRARRGEVAKPRQYLGLGVAGLIAAGLVETVPAVGAGLSLLIAAGVTLEHGDGAMDALLGATEGTKKFAQARASVIPAPRIWGEAESGGGYGPGLPGEQSPTAPPFSGTKGRIIGTPYRGTHTRGNWESDNAVDVSLPHGTPLYACASGRIGSSFGSFGSSEAVLQGLRLHIISDSYGDAFYYAHLSRFASGIRPGVRVKKGQILGYSGTANGSPHLHLGVRPPLTPFAFYRLTYRR